MNDLNKHPVILHINSILQYLKRDQILGELIMPIGILKTYSKISFDNNYKLGLLFENKNNPLPLKIYSLPSKIINANISKIYSKLDKLILEARPNDEDYYLRTTLHVEKNMIKGKLETMSHISFFGKRYYHLCDIYIDLANHISDMIIQSK